MNASARGFTLVEMLLAMVITATVAAAAMTALDQLTDADARATQHIESTVGVYRALQTLRRDLADCKMVTAWPTLVDPHDLQFLLGTRELRRWLWPHTIQNPADDLATIDARLKWAELLPW